MVSTLPFSLSLYLPQSLHSHSLCLSISHSLCTPILFVFLPPTVSALPFSLSFYLPQSLPLPGLTFSHSSCLYPMFLSSFYSLVSLTLLLKGVISSFFFTSSIVYSSHGCLPHTAKFVVEFKHLQQSCLTADSRPNRIRKF